VVTWAHARVRTDGGTDKGGGGGQVAALKKQVAQLTKEVAAAASRAASAAQIVESPLYGEFYIVNELGHCADL
jgi:hypothetical protein